MRIIILAFFLAGRICLAGVSPDSGARPASIPPMAVSLPMDKPIDLGVFNDRSLIMREYGFGVAGTVVAGTFGFFIGSGLESAFMGAKAHKGTLSFTGIRYDNYKGAFWGGATGMLAGCALANYFTGQTDEEDGSFFWTLVGAGLAQSAAMYLASAAGVTRDVGWIPFIPLIILPSAGGTLGFNDSRWFRDRKRESIVGREAAMRLRAPRVAWGMDSGGGGVFSLQALNLSF